MRLEPWVNATESKTSLGIEENPEANSHGQGTRVQTNFLPLNVNAERNNKSECEGI